VRIGVFGLYEESAVRNTDAGGDGEIDAGGTRSLSTRALWRAEGENPIKGGARG